MMWSYHASSAWLWPAVVTVVAIGAGLIAVALVSQRRSGSGGAAAAEEILSQRLARGDIDEAGYRQRLAALRAAPPPRQQNRRRRSAPALIIAAAALTAAASLTAVAAAASPSGRAGVTRAAAARGCTVPALGGHTVDVTLQDVGAMMAGAPPAGMMGQGSYPSGGVNGAGTRMRMMRVTVSPTAVPAGEVSFRVLNAGSLTHELVVLPLAAGQPGSRTVGADGTVSERGSLGEASATCAAGAGEGIAPGGTGWVTLHLAAGRYELTCNVRGHYALGMFTELDVR